MASYGQSVTICYVAWNTSSNAGQTGDSANHTLKLVKDGSEASPTNAPSQVDATNCPGVYSLVLTSAEASHNVVLLAGISSTSNVVLIPVQISFELLPTALDANGFVKADVEDWKGSTAPALTGDPYAAINTKVPTALTYDANNLPKVDVADILGSASVGAAGYVGVDWAHIDNPTSTVGLTNTTVENAGGTTNYYITGAGSFSNQPVVVTKLFLQRGQSYLSAESNALVWNLVTAMGALASASVSLYDVALGSAITTQSPVLTGTSGTTPTVAIDMTAAQVNALNPGTRVYQLQVTYASGATGILAQGDLVVG